MIGVLEQTVFSRAYLKQTVCLVSICAKATSFFVFFSFWVNSVLYVCPTSSLRHRGGCWEMLSTSCLSAVGGFPLRDQRCGYVSVASRQTAEFYSVEKYPRL